MVKLLIKEKRYDMLRLRLKWYLGRHKKKKPIWICSDRTDMGRDNGERFFRYLNQTEAADKFDLYFVLDKKSSDIKRMKQYGKVLTLGSKEYKLRFLLADKIISAHADPWVYDAFGEEGKYVKDLIDFDFVFLQHGIIKDDFSEWLHKQNKNIDLFITSSRLEQESIQKGSYGYDPQQIVLTGLPRFDALKDTSQKQILIFPTWRKELAAPLADDTSERDYLEDFKETDYFRFYNSLINDPQLIRTLKEHGYQAEFYVHPAFKKQAGDFVANDTVKVISGEADYSDMFARNALLVTDYSSVYFDFAYMKKPVVYSMFDYDRYYQTHTCERGYFDYQTDGFGPICYDLGSTVQAIGECLKKECQMEDIYRERVERFFAWTDKNNCKRVYEEILKMDQACKL